MLELFVIGSAFATGLVFCFRVLLPHVRRTFLLTQLNAFLDSSPAGFALIDPHHRFLMINKRLASINKLSVAAHLGRTLEEVVPQVSRSVGRLVDQVARTREPITDLEVTGLMGDQLSTCLLCFYPVKAGSEFVGVGISLTDVSQVKEAEKELALSRAQLAQERARLMAIIENLPAGVLIWDATQREMISNKRARDLVDPQGQYPDTYSALQALRVGTGDGRDLPHHLWPLTRAIAYGEAVTDETFIIRRADGSSAYLTLYATPLYTHHGRMNSAICVILDVTEKQVREQYDIRAEQMFRRIGESNVIGILTGGSDGAVWRANDRFLEMIGYSREELEKGEVNWRTLTVNPDNDKVAVKELWEHGFCTPYFKDFRRKDGSLVHVLIGGALSGSGDKATCFVLDLTERKRFEESLQQAKEAAEAASHLKSAFLANVSHEIRTPLSAIMGYADLLSSGDATPSDVAHYSDVIRRNGEQLSSLINDILDLSKVEAGKLQLESVPVDLKQLLLDVLSAFGPKAKDKKISLRVRFISPIPQMITSDPVRLRQILYNLVGNALKFTEKGFVEVCLRYEHHTLFVDIQDSGIGLSAEQSRKLFEPFTQADQTTARRFGGTGLGLALSRKLARSLGGDLILRRSELGHGSEFAFHIRAEPQEPSKWILNLHSPLNADSPTFRPTATPSLAGISVLLVDDSADNRALVQRLLKLAGATVTEAATGREALERVSGGKFHVILMDVQMPQMDGYEATIELRKRGVRTPIIALTAHAMNEERERCLKAGFDDHLTKPIDRRLLIERINFFAQAGQQSWVGAP